VPVTIWGLTWRKPLPPPTDEQRASIRKEGTPQAEAERLLGPPVRVEKDPSEGAVCVYEAKIDREAGARRGYDDGYILKVKYEAGAVSCVQVNFGHRYTPLGKLLNDLTHE